MARYHDLIFRYGGRNGLFQRETPVASRHPSPAKQVPGGGSGGVVPRGQVLPVLADSLVASSMLCCGVPLCAEHSSAVGSRSPPAGGEVCGASGSGWVWTGRRAGHPGFLWLLPAEGDHMGLCGSVLTKMAAHLAGLRMRVLANCLDRGGWGDRRSWWRGRPIGAGGLGRDALPYVRHQHLTECVRGTSEQQHAVVAGHHGERARILAAGLIALQRMDGAAYAVGGRNRADAGVRYCVRQTLTETIGSGVQERGATLHTLVAGKGIANYVLVNYCSVPIGNCATPCVTIKVDLGWRLVRTAHGDGSGGIIERRLRR